MNRIALGVLLSSSFLVAACGDNRGKPNEVPPVDAPTSHARCGDGIVDVATETCDDGNTTSGDGCSSTCQTEIVNKCGNGALDTGETCDDGNQAGSDGCSAQCTVETGYMCTGSPSVCTVMSAADGTCANPFPMTFAMTGPLYSATGAGDTTTATNQVDVAACDQEMPPTFHPGAGHDQIWSFTNPAAGPVLITVNHSVATFDVVLRMTTTACSVTTEVPDDLLPDDVADGASDGCADLQVTAGDERLNYNNLPAGTYYVVIDGYSATANGAYSFTVQAGHGTCGNGAIEFGETCDDSNTATGDGCDDTCHVEGGYTCTGTPSVCAQTCGNGVHDTGEACDDHNTAAGDGCSATCQIETGYACTTTYPSVCHMVVCGDGVVEGTETCDDHNIAANDGCGATCQTETGYTCSGSPSHCVFGGTCAQPIILDLTASGAGYVGTGSSTTAGSTDQTHAFACDSETTPGNAPDQVWKFVNPVTQPVLITVIGNQTSYDALIRLTSTACDTTTQIPDDLLSGDTASGVADGCADLHASGTNERLNFNMLPAGTYYIDIDGYSATSSGTYKFTVVAGTPATCGNFLLDTGETCDDGNAVVNDGCGATCQVETGYACAGTPSVCHPVVCGDGVIDTGEACDDHNAAAGDGCSATCQVEAGYTCTGTPSVCVLPVCGNGVIEGSEECDSSAAHDHCDVTCHLVFDTTDTEVNDTGVAAQVIAPVSHIIEGTLPVGDRDIYKVTLTAPSILQLESYTTFASSYVATSTISPIKNFECTSSDTELRVFAGAADPALDTGSLYYNDDGGEGACSYIAPTAVLAAGTYYLEINEYNADAAITRYLIDFKVTPM